MTQVHGAAPHSAGFSAQVPLRGPFGDTEMVELTCSGRWWSEDGRPRRECRIALATPAAVSAEGVGEDFFDALCRLREKLNAADYWLICYGASINVMLSGMARDMGGGLVGYLVRARGQARSVGILDTGPAVQPVTVAEQREFARRTWLRSFPAETSESAP